MNIDFLLPIKNNESTKKDTTSIHRAVHPSRIFHPLDLQNRAWQHGDFGANGIKRTVIFPLPIPAPKNNTYGIMKTAVLMSGEMRTFAKLHKNQWWTLYRHLEDPHFFVSVADDDQAADAEILWRYVCPSKVFIERVTQPTLSEPDESCAYHAPYAISVPVQAILRQLWALARCYSFMCECVNVNEFDLFVRARPDSHYYYFDPMFLPSEIDPDEYFTPWWGRFGGVNDRFAILGKNAAYYYFNTLSDVGDLLAAGCPLHPESLVKHSMLMGSCHGSDRFPVEFATVRMNGELRQPEISASDLARGMMH